MDLTTNRYSQSSLAQSSLVKISPNNFSSKRVKFSLWFVINCTPRHCGVEEWSGKEKYHRMINLKRAPPPLTKKEVSPRKKNKISENLNFSM